MWWSSTSVRLGILLLTVASVAVSCGRKSPAAPDQTEVPVLPLLTPPGLTLTLLSSSGGQNAVRISWGPVDRATGYIVEAGTTPGSSTNLLLVQTSALTYDWAGAPSGLAYVRVKSKNDTQTSIASAERTIAVLDIRDYVEAIFLGTGPFADNVNAGHGCFNTSYSRAKVGDTTTVRISTSIPGGDIAAIMTELDSLRDVAHGLDFRLQTTDDPDPTPASGEVTMAAIPQADVTRLCRTPAGGCAIKMPPTDFFLRTVRIVVAQGSPSSHYFHEAGHGVFGLCHAAVGDYQTLMNASGSQLATPHFSEFDRMAIDAVFGAGMVPGATRADFAARGLVRP